MSKSIKLKDNNYWDSKGIVHNQELLSNILNNLKNVSPIVDTNWGNTNKTIEIDNNYLYIVFVSWEQKCLLYQYANGTQVTRELNGSGGYTVTRNGNTVTINIGNTGVMYGIKVKV